MSVQQAIAPAAEAPPAPPFPGATRFPTDLVDLATVPGFLDPAECVLLMQLIDAGCRPSQVAWGEAGARTSDTCAFDAAAPVVRLLDLRLSLLLGIAPAHGEPIQGQRYRQGQEFRLHTDYFEPHHPDQATHARRSGQRTWTAMIYLNAPDAGGETFFHYLDHAFVPEPGTLLCWNNVGADGHANPHTLHQGRPVLAGSKYIVTKWYRERAWQAPAAKMRYAIKGRR